VPHLQGQRKGRDRDRSRRGCLRKAKVAVLVGDWTNGDPALGRFIEAHNRAGVPLYLWYKPGNAEPECCRRC
jgi:thiol:disulfide interchange protein